MWEMLEAWVKIAPAFTPIVAAVAVGVAWRQLRLNRNSQRETTAKVTFREYLKLAFENPDLAAGKIDRTSGRFEAYTWFVGYFLWAVEEVLHFAKNDPVWLENVRLQMLAHRNYFRNDEEFRSRELPTYTPAVQALVERVVRTV
jgi:hypothetical protein